MLRYRRRLRVAPGVYLNFSTSGVSTTIGPRGFNVNIGKRGVFLNAGIPGTGIYLRKKIGEVGGKVEKIEERQIPKKNLYSVKSSSTKDLSSEKFLDLKQALYQGLRDRYWLLIEAKRRKRKYFLAKFINIFLKFLLIGFFLPFLKKWLFKNFFSYHKTRLRGENYRLKFHVKMEKDFFQEFTLVKQYFQELAEKSRVWDVVARDFVPANLSYDYSFRDLERVTVDFLLQDTELISLVGEKPLCLQNANGGSLYLYPFFILVQDMANLDFAIVELQSLIMSHRKVRFLENESVPAFTKYLGVSYLHVRSNGQRDLRYRVNPQYPVCLYYELHLKTAEGLNEIYLFSNAELAEKFCLALEKYIRHVGKIEIFFN